MSLSDSFVTPMSNCLAPGFTFPPITEPGMPNFVLGCFGATFAGINYALQFIPPTPLNLPDIKPPGIDIFLQGFLAGIKLPASYPGFSFGPLVIPAVGNAPYAYDMSGELKLMAVCILLPFKLIEKLITGLLNLEINIPTFEGIMLLFDQIALDVGIATPSVSDFGGCLAGSIAKLFTALI